MDQIPVFGFDIKNQYNTSKLIGKSNSDTNPEQMKRQVVESSY